MQKNKFRINILDFLIIILVLLCAAGAFLRVYTKNNDGKLDMQTATIEFLIQDIPTESQYAFGEGDVLYCYDFERELGTLVGDLVVEDAVYYDVLESAEIKRSTSSGERIDVRGTFVCKGSKTENGEFAIGGTQYIAPNMSLGVAFPNIKEIILITDVKVH